MHSFDREPPTERMAAVGNVLGAAFLVGFVGFTGFCFVFGLAFTLVVIVLTVLAANNGAIVGGVFWVIFPPFMVGYEYVSWRLFWFGLTTLRGDRPTGETRG